MRILIAYRAIDQIAGGVEKMTAALMNEMCARGHEVHFFTLDHADAKSFYEHDKRITWHKMAIGDWQQKASWATRLKRFRAGRELLKKLRPDIIIGFQDGAFHQMRAYSAGLGIPVLLAERIAPSHFNFTGAGKTRKLRYQTYRLAKRITAQCESYIEKYPPYLRDKITVIPNPVKPVKKKASPAGQTDAPKTQLCVGRIGYQKNQEVLLRAFAQLHEKHPDWTLTLAGGAAELDFDAEALSKELGISEKVTLPGPVKNVEELYLNSHLFCLPSRWEGFPNALAEAMSYGLPCVGFEACGGVRDLITHEKTGLLAAGNENEDSLVSALDTLMSNAKLRETMGTAGRKTVAQYKPKVIFDRWENLFNEVIAKK